MKATYSAERHGATNINIIFKESEREDAEKVGQYMVDEYDYEWVAEEDDCFVVGHPDSIIKEAKKDWKAAKAAYKAA